MSTSSLALAFAKTYYTRLSQNPELVYRFYGEDSTVLHGAEGSSNDSRISKGQAEIRAKFAENQQIGTLYLIRDVVSIPTAGNCILVTVLGELAAKDSDPQQFSQTFILARMEENELYILTDILRIFNSDFDAEVEPATGAINEARHLVENVTLKDSDPESKEATAKQVTTTNPNPNSWASILAKPQPSPPPPKTVPRAAVPTTTAGTIPRAPGQFSAFLKLSSSTAITKPIVVKALAPFGPIANLQLDPTKKRGYVDFPDKRMFEKALKTARVKIPGGRENIEILKRFTTTSQPSKANGTGGNIANHNNSAKRGTSRK